MLFGGAGQACWKALPHSERFAIEADSRCKRWTVEESQAFEYQPVINSQQIVDGLTDEQDVHIKYHNIS